MSRSEKKNLFGFINGLLKKETNEVQSDSKYIENLKQYDFMTNTPDKAISETKIYSHVHAFLDKCGIKDSKAAVTCDMYARSVLNAVKKREEEFNEEWLCIFANDHGGLGRNHGRQNPEEKMTWIATNIPIE